MTAVDPASRYARLPSISVPVPDEKGGGARVLGAPRMAPDPGSQGAYTVRPGDRLDLLGHAATSDSTRWWVLADANPYRDATRLESPGETIELPRG
ncbi:MAG: hypothetical protein ACR2KK_02750 [Acidimicrobiales bacterium]